MSQVQRVPEKVAEKEVLGIFGTRPGQQQVQQRVSSAWLRSKFRNNYLKNVATVGDIAEIYYYFFKLSFVQLKYFNSPNRLTCMGFLLLSKGCIPGPHDFASVSGLASHSGCLGPNEFTLVSSVSPTLGALGRMSLHLSPPCLPLWVPWAA